MVHLLFLKTEIRGTADFSPIGADFGDENPNCAFLMQNHRKFRKDAISSGAFLLFDT